MTIVSNRNHLFGLSHVAVMKWPTMTTGCVVCTAPEGLFKPYSTIFQLFEGDQWNASDSNLRPVAKAWLSPSFSKAQAAEAHNLILTRIEAAMVINKGDVEKAIYETVKAMEERHAAVHSTFAPDMEENLAENHLADWLKEHPDATEDEKIDHICDGILAGWEEPQPPDPQQMRAAARTILANHYAGRAST